MPSLSRRNPQGPARPQPHHRRLLRRLRRGLARQRRDLPVRRAADGIALGPSGGVQEDFRLLPVLPALPQAPLSGAPGRVRDDGRLRGLRRELVRPGGNRGRQPPARWTHSFPAPRHRGGRRRPGRQRHIRGGPGGSPGSTAALAANAISKGGPGGSPQVDRRLAANAIQGRPGRLPLRVDRRPGRQRHIQGRRAVLPGRPPSCPIWGSIPAGSWPPSTACWRPSCTPRPHS